MRSRAIIILLQMAVLGVVVSSLGAGYTTITASMIKDMMIDNKKNTRAIILLDIRRDDEVASGIIASENCKPYHIIWGDPQWDARYKDLPKDSAIILYCRSGSRVQPAAKFLIDNGYTMVAIMEGGILKYPQASLVDSTNFKPWSNLPAPSYTPPANVVLRKTPNTIAKPLSQEVQREMFNLRGQRIESNIADPNAPVFILERIGSTNRKRLNGIHYLVQSDR